VTGGRQPDATRQGIGRHLQAGFGSQRVSWIPKRQAQLRMEADRVRARVTYGGYVHPGGGRVGSLSTSFLERAGRGAAMTVWMSLPTELRYASRT